MSERLSSSSEELLARIVSDPQLIREALADPDIEEEFLLRFAAHPTLMREVLADPEIEDKWRSRLVADPQLLQKVIERVDIALLDMKAIRLYLYAIKFEEPADRNL